MTNTKPKTTWDYPLLTRFRGEYDYDGLLALIRGFFTRHFFDKQEPKFKYKTGGTGSEVEFKIIGERKLTQYLKADLTVEGHLWDVVRKGGVTGGKVEIKINGKVTFDYEGSFTDKQIHKWMQKTMDAPGTGLQYGDNKVTGEKFMEKITKKLQKEIKKHLKMECV